MRRLNDIEGAARACINIGGCTTQIFNAILFFVPFAIIYSAISDTISWIFPIHSAANMMIRWTLAFICLFFSVLICLCIRKLKDIGYLHNQGQTNENNYNTENEGGMEQMRDFL
jgi:preprotein translocase subunit SecG